MEDSKLIHHLCCFLTFHKSFQATSNPFSLLRYFEGRSTENIQNFASNMLKDYNISDLRVSSWCLMMVERLFLAVPWGCLQFVIVEFPDHTHLLFLGLYKSYCSF